jgi:hypothetical protein
VTNRRGRHAAEDVEVLIVTLEQTNRVPPEAGLRVNFGPLGWTHIEPTHLTIGPGVTRTVDLGYIASPANIFRLGVKPEPLSDSHLLQQGTWEIVLAVGARNTDARHYKLTLWFDGTWGNGGEDVWNHLKITKLPEGVSPPTFHE